MSGPTGPTARLEGVGVRFGERWALHDVTLEVAPGERVAVVGPSGAGKTTLLRVLGGGARPTEGRVLLFGHDWAALGGRRRRAVQRRVGTVHQQLDLVGPLRVVHNVNAGHLGRWPAARALWSLAVPREVAGATEALDRVGLGDRLHERTDRLSGGQQQRVALARLLVQHPDLVLADEPVASLDPARAVSVMDLLAGLAAGGASLVVSVHASHFALSHCDRVVGLRQGRVAFDRPVPEVAAADLDSLYRLDLV